MAHVNLDLDTFEPVVSEREDCEKPTGCVCQADEPCQWPKLMAQVPQPRAEADWGRHE